MRDVIDCKYHFAYKMTYSILNKKYVRMMKSFTLVTVCKCYITKKFLCQVQQVSVQQQQCKEQLNRLITIKNKTFWEFSKEK